MGLSSSPYIATMAMNFTFSDSVLEKFKEEMGYADFDFSSYDQFLSYYLDDCIIYTSKSNKSEKYSIKQIHLIALESVIFALNLQGWIASLKKANLMSDQLVFLGDFICTKIDSCMETFVAIYHNDFQNCSACWGCAGLGKTSFLMVINVYLH